MWGWPKRYPHFVFDIPPTSVHNDYMTSTYNTNRRLTQLLLKTLYGYSVSSYGVTNWTMCLRMLMRRGYTDAQIIAIMLSKWTRWASDNKESLRGRATSRDLESFMKGQSAKSIDDLVAGYDQSELTTDSRVW